MGERVQPMMAPARALRAWMQRRRNGSSHCFSIQGTGGLEALMQHGRRLRKANKEGCIAALHLGEWSTVPWVIDRVRFSRGLLPIA